MTDINKQAPAAQEIKPEEPKKTKAELKDKQLDQVTGGTMICATGKHIPTGKITV